MIRVLIADDHTIVREGVKQLIALTLDIVVTAEAGSGEQVLQQLHEKEVDVVLLDINMPPPSGVELIEQIREMKSDIPILIFSMHNEMHIVSNALRVGATGYCSKNSDPKLLLDALRKVYAGQRYLDSQISESMALASAFPEILEPHILLSKREREVLVMLAQGKNINTISEKLAISNKTVSTHKANLMDKMSFGSIAELVRYAGEHGLLA
jgi:DNA-binding NarL/FixJ family response regulator